MNIKLPLISPDPRWEVNHDNCIFKPRPNINNIYFPNKIYVKTNSEGFREKYENVLESNNIILVLGDSHVFGQNVSFEFTFTEILKKETNKNFINAGSFGSSPKEYYFSVKDIFLKKNKNINKIIIFINLFNDVLEDRNLEVIKNYEYNHVRHLDEVLYSNFRFQNKDTFTNSKEKCFSKSMNFFNKIEAYSYINSYFYRTLKNEYYLKKIAAKDLNLINQFNYTQEEYKNLYKTLDSIKLLVEKKNIDLEFVIFPWLNELNIHYLNHNKIDISKLESFRKPREDLIKFFKKKNYKYFDLFNCLENTRPEENIYQFNSSDSHLSEKGYKLIASCFIKDQ